jgi:glycyl-tRNA synthetase alpha subunit
MMSGFLFNRRSASEENAAPAPVMPKTEVLTGAAQVQAITASAIFALLVSKGVISADEAAEYMAEIGLALQRDVEGPLGAEAGAMLRSYGKALAAAGE